MGDADIRAALEGASDTRDVVIGAGALDGVGDLYARAFGDAPAIVVADGTTFDVAGRDTHERLAAAGVAVREPHVLPARPIPYADHDTVTGVAAALREHDDAVPVAVGAGTLNDLVKLAADDAGRPYLCVGTAASVDGYTAFGAAIAKGGYKQTISCPAPRAVLADLDLMAGAPPDMTAAGYADLLAKITAGADWITADALDVEPIDEDIWSLVQGSLRDATARPEAVAAGDREALRALIEGLVMSGLAMQAHESSRPASGAEHQFSHLWEMEGLGLHPEDGGPPLSHGFKVAIGTISSAALYERVLARDLTALDVDAAVAAWPDAEAMEREVRAAHPAAEIAEAAVGEMQAKHVDADALRERLELLRERWPDLRERLAAHLIAPGELRAMLDAAGAPTTPEAIGLDAAALRETYARARTIRRRFTVLDLAAQAGILDACLDELFAPGGVWGT